MFGFGKKQKSAAEMQADRNRALHKAVKRGDITTINKMLDEGADIEARLGMLKEPPLVTAAWEGRTETLRVLLDRGAQIEAKGSGGYTALHLSVKFTYPAAVVFLLERGASPYATDDSGHTPLHYAEQHSNPDLLNAIRIHLKDKELEREKRRRENAERLAAAAQKQKEEEDARRQQMEREIITFQRQQGDLSVEDAFDFVNFERTTFVRRGAGGPVESVTRQEFAEIANSRALRRAFEEHVKRGGTVGEAEVFPDAKPKLPRPPGVQP